MNKDIDLSIAALLLAFLTLQNAVEAFEAVRTADPLLALWEAVACIGCAFLTRAVWRAA